MKYILSISLLCIFLAACGDKGKQPETVKMPVQATYSEDSTGIAETLHAFFKWYGETGEQLITRIDFVDTKGPHPLLDEALLANYLAEYTKSGTVNAKFVENETKFYRACAELWKNENSDEMFSGFDLDHYYCQQDGDVTEFLKAPVSAKISGDFATVQLLLDPNGPNGGPRSFEMNKENGKWLISKLGCETGIEVK